MFIRQQRLIYVFLSFVCGIYSTVSAQQASQADYEQAYNQALDFFNNDNPQKGFEYLNKAIGLNPSFYDAIYARSYYLMQSEKYEEAIADYNLLIYLYPENPNLFLYRGQAYLHQENFEEAEINYLQAFEMDSSDVDIANSLGSLYFILDLYQDALIYLNKALMLAPNDLFAHYYRASTYFQLENYEEAMMDIQQALKIYPNDLDLLRLQVRIYIGKKSYKNAIAIFEDFQDKDIDFSLEDFYYWGLAYYRQRKFPDAEFYLELPENHNYPPIYHYLARTKYRLNQSKEALGNLNRAIESSDSLSETSAPLYYDRAVSKYRLRDLEGAQKDYFHSLYLVPELLDSTYRTKTYPDLLANAYVMLKLDRQPEKIDSIRLLGYQDRSSAFISSGNLMLAQEACNAALKLDSTNSYNHTLLATILAMQGGYDAALLAVEKAQSYQKQKQPENNFYIKGLIYGAIGRLSEGIENLSEALKLNPDNPTYYAERASLYYQHFDSLSALADISKAIELAPETYDYYISRAEYYVFSQKFSLAIPDCDTVLTYEPDNIYALYFRGIAYSEVGKIELSLLDLEKVQEALPDDPELEDLIAELRSTLKEID